MLVLLCRITSTRLLTLVTPSGSGARRGLGGYGKGNGNEKTADTKQDMPMAEKHLKRCSTAKIIGRCKLQQQNPPTHPSERHKSTTLTGPNADKGEDQQQLSFTESLTQLNTPLLCNPATVLLAIYLRESKHVHTKTCV